MLSRIEHHPAMQFATLERGQVTRQSSQAFLDLLARESQEAHLAEPAKSPVETPEPEVAGGGSRQNPVIPQPSSQVPDTSETATSTFSALAIFAPKSGSGGQSDGPQSTPAADTTNSAFVPEFQQNLAVVSAYGGSSALNPIYFATKETAQWIANKYGTGELVARPYDATGGPYTANGTEYYIRLKDGGLVNAGLLADYYQRMSAFEADTVIRQGLGEA